MANLQHLGWLLLRTTLKQRLFAAALVLAAVVVMQVRTKAHVVREVAVAKRARAVGRPIPVRTTRVSQSDVVEIVWGTAITAVSKEISIVAGRASDPGPRDYIVRQIHAPSGTFVTQGTVLIEFEDALFVQALKHRKAELAAAAEIRETPGRLETRQQVLDAEAAYHRAQLNLDLARSELAACRLKATIDGFVGEVSLVDGDRVAFGSTITRVQQVNPIYVVMDLPQEKIKDVQFGQSAEVAVDCFPDESFVGTIVRIPPGVDPKTRTLPVVIQVPNPEYRIKAGVSGSVRLRITKNAVTVPSIAAIRQGNKAMVFRVEDNRARICEVEVGEVVEPGRIEILRGISHGDEVVIFGAEYLRDNDRVNTDWKSWAGRRNN